MKSRGWISTYRFVDHHGFRKSCEFGVSLEMLHTEKNDDQVIWWLDKDLHSFFRWKTIANFPVDNVE